jgi:hypothetical protein
MRFMIAKIPAENIDCLDTAHEPSDAELAAVMADVSRVVKEKRNMAYVRLHESVNDEMHKALARMEYLRKQFKVPRL